MKIKLLSAAAETYQAGVNKIGGTLLELLENGRIYLEHHEGILDYHDDQIIVAGKKIKIIVKGDHLKIQIITEDYLVITGCIRNISLEEGA